MKLRLVTMIAALAAATLITPVQAKTFRFAFQGDLNALDPYALNETFTLGTLGNVMEGLVTRDKDLKIVPALAESWEIVEPTRWRFHLRKGVKFHNGEAFTADDVLFSLERALSPESNIRTRLAPKIKAEKVDDAHGRLRCSRAEPDPPRGVGWLVHHVEVMGRGQRRHQSPWQEQSAQPLCADGERHRPVHGREP